MTEKHGNIQGNHYCPFEYRFHQKSVGFRSDGLFQDRSIGISRNINKWDTLLTKLPGQIDPIEVPLKVDVDQRDIRPALLYTRDGLCHGLRNPVNSMPRVAYYGAETSRFEKLIFNYQYL